jgi:single-strand DNA-binding protein
VSNINTVTISGNLTRDPELKHIPSGTALCQLGVAVNKSRKMDDGSYQDETSFFDVDVWSGFGELVANKFQKGDSIIISGELKQERWETDEGNRSKVKIVARSVDGAAMYRKAGETSAPAETPTPGSSQSDDIPF